MLTLPVAERKCICWKLKCGSISVYIGAIGGPAKAGKFLGLLYDYVSDLAAGNKYEN